MYFQDDYPTQQQRDSVTACIAENRDI